MANYSIGQLQQLSRQAGWPENLVEKAGAIWKYESGGNPHAHNPNGEDSWGLCQINWPYHKEFNRAQLIDPIYNLQACYKIYRGEGWDAWYNSNKKYNSNYQGIAAQSRAIYNNGGQPSTVVTASQVQAIFNTTPEPIAMQSGGDTALKVAVGLFALFVLTRF